MTRLRGGSAGSSRGAASLITQAIHTVRACGATGQVLVRANSAVGSGAVVSACRNAGVNSAVTLQTNSKIRAAIAATDETAWTPVRYPGAVQDPDTGDWISDAQVAETSYTVFEAKQPPGHRPARRAPRQSTGGLLPPCRSCLPQGVIWVVSALGLLDSKNLLHAQCHACLAW